MDQQRKLNIEPIANIQRFINNYPDQQLHQYFNILKQSFPYHRVVKGEGNCFYRAFAFLYLSSNQFSSFQNTFKKISMNYKKKGTFIKSNYHFENQLKIIWDRYLSKLSNIKESKTKQQKIQMLFNQVQVFDELMIGYFRSVNYQYIKSNIANLKPFLQQSQNIQLLLQRVSTFGAQSEGIQIYSLAQALNTKITIFCIDYRGFQPVQYKQNLEQKGFYLFFRPGHYDIVYPQHKNSQNYSVSNSNLKKQTAYQNNSGFFSRLSRRNQNFKSNNINSKIVSSQKSQKNQMSKMKINQGRQQQKIIKPKQQSDSDDKQPQKPPTVKKVMLGSFQNGPMSKVWVQMLAVGVLSFFAFVVYKQFD